MSDLVRIPNCWLLVFSCEGSVLICLFQELLLIPAGLTEEAETQIQVSRPGQFIQFLTNKGWGWPNKERKWSRSDMDFKILF